MHANIHQFIHVQMHSCIYPFMHSSILCILYKIYDRFIHENFTELYVRISQLTLNDL